MGENRELPQITIIILNWNGKEDTIECLESVMKINYPTFQAVVVDNGSVDGSVGAIKASFPDIKILETGRNLGYAGGNNVGIRYALENGAEYILLLNNDTVVPDNLLTVLVEASLADRREDVLGASIYHYYEPDRLWCSVKKWSDESGRFDGIHPQGGNEVYETDYVSGCAIFMPASVLRHIGLLDEDFFLTYEETDWCYRAREAGYNCYVVSNASLLHKVSVAIGGSDSPLACYFWVRNQLVWARRHLNKKGRRAVWRAIFGRLHKGFLPPVTLGKEGPLTKRALWAGATWVRNLRANLNSKSNRAMLIGLYHYFTKRMGDCPEDVRRWTEDAKSARKQGQLSC